MQLTISESRELILKFDENEVKADDYIQEKWGSWIENHYASQWEGEKNTEIMHKDDHSRHNQDPEYQEHLLLPLVRRKNFLKGKTALDIGCGTGRNINNLLANVDFSRVDGCDISYTNCTKAKEAVDARNGVGKCKTWKNNGYNLSPAGDNEYDFVMSHLVFQHIPNYLMRLSLFNDIYRVLNVGGFTIVHFLDLPESEPYDSLYPYDLETDSPRNCRVGNATNLIKDFIDLGFKGVSCTVGCDPHALEPSYYLRGYK